MTDTVQCEIHGEAKRTFVCQHVVDGILQRQRVGFFWTRQDRSNPHPDAWCADCEHRVSAQGGEWRGEALELLKPQVLCSGCYEAARVFHIGGELSL